MNSTLERKQRSRSRLAEICPLTWIISTLSFFVLLYLSICPPWNSAFGFPFNIMGFERGREQLLFASLLADLAILGSVPIIIGAVVQRVARNLNLLLENGRPQLHLSTMLVVVNCVAIDLLLNSIECVRYGTYVAYGWPLRSVEYELGWHRCNLACEFINVLTLVLIALTAAFLCEWRIYKQRTGVRENIGSAVLPEENA